MAQRSSRRDIRYGGRFCGVLNGVTKSIDTYIGPHIRVDETHPGPPYRTGGPLLVTKKIVDIEQTQPYHARYSPVPIQTWDGFLWTRPYIPSPEPTPKDISGWAAYGWNRAHPLHPIYSLGVSIAELKDLPRMLTQTRQSLNKLRGLKLSLKPKTVREFLHDANRGAVQSGSDYLNVQFGWVPVIQDLIFLYNMKKKLDNKIAWLRSINGKSIRRKFELDYQNYSQDIPRVIAKQGTMSPVLPSQLYSGGVVGTYPIPILHSYTSRIWFSSKWRVAMPELDDLQSNQTFLKLDLLGIALDPGIIWKITPWSWLLDWFGDMGTVISNLYLRAKHGVVAEYAYCMCRETYAYDAPGYVDVHVGNRVSGIWSEADTRLSGVSRTRYEFRQRVAANPFGFGSTFSSLSEYQWSILVALGLSRGGKHYAPRS